MLQKYVKNEDGIKKKSTNWLWMFSPEAQDIFAYN
jgi:hypothetical protein